MIALKFLGTGAVGLHSGFVWPTPPNRDPGPWVAVDGPLVPGRNGIHACTGPELTSWLDDELWEIELDGAVESSPGLLVAPRGRLLRRSARWNAEAALAFAESCLLSIRDAAVSAVGSESERGRSLAAAVELDAVEAMLLQWSTSDDALLYLADAVMLARGGRPDGVPPALAGTPSPGAVAANLGFVAAHICGHVAAAGDEPEAYDAGFKAERDRQASWLRQRLQLAERDTTLSRPREEARVGSDLPL